MKKHWGAFWITETILLMGTLAAAITLYGVHWTLSALASVSGSIGAAAYFLHFRSLEYLIENGTVIICKGFIVKSRRGIPAENILITQWVTVFGYTLFTEIKTAGGTAVLFCEIGLTDIQDRRKL